MEDITEIDRCARYLAQIRNVMISMMCTHLDKFIYSSNKVSKDESHTNFSSACIDHLSHIFTSIQEIEASFINIKNLYVIAMNKIMFNNMVVIEKFARSAQYLSCYMNFKIFILKAAFIDHKYIGGGQMCDLSDMLSEVSDNYEDISACHNVINYFYLHLLILSKPIDDAIATSLGKYIGRTSERGHVVVK